MYFQDTGAVTAEASCSVTPDVGDQQSDSFSLAGVSVDAAIAALDASLFITIGNVRLRMLPLLLYTPVSTRPVNPVAPSPNVRTGLVWTGCTFKATNSTFAPVFPWRLELPFDSVDGSVDNRKRCEALEKFRRGGTGFLADLSGVGGRTVSINADWSFNSTLSYSFTNTGVSFGLQGDQIQFSARLLTPLSECPEYAELPDNACEIPVYMRVAVRCDGEPGEVVYDPTLKPPSPNGRTMTVDGIRYRPTATQVIAEPVAVIWSPAECDEEPPVDPDFAIATRCPTNNPFDLDNTPAQIVYAVNPGVGVGNGTVSLLRLFNEPCPPPQGDRQCQRIIRYLPTSTPADGPADLGATHAPGVPCAPNQTICEDCGDIVVPSIESMTDRNNRILREQGFDAAKETRALKQGGDCGCSQYTYS